MAHKVTNCPGWMLRMAGAPLRPLPFPRSLPPRPLPPVGFSWVIDRESNLLKQYMGGTAQFCIESLLNTERSPDYTTSELSELLDLVNSSSLIKTASPAEARRSCRDRRAGSSHGAVGSRLLIQLLFTGAAVSDLTTSTSSNHAVPVAPCNLSEIFNRSPSGLVFTGNSNNCQSNVPLYFAGCLRMNF
jgi:hypothetical protein